MRFISCSRSNWFLDETSNTPSVDALPLLKIHINLSPRSHEANPDIEIPPEINSEATTENHQCRHVDIN